jgi:hypothetical protein
MRGIAPWLLLGFAATTLAVACSAGHSQQAASSFGGGGAGAGGPGASGSQGGALTVGSGGAATGPNFDAACGIVTEEAHGAQVDLYIALDRSSSMAGDKWDGAKDGLKAFLTDKTSAGLEVALNFFPLDGSPTCDQMTYKTPAVDFGALPGNAAALDGAMSSESPSGFDTPIYPALGGAILGAKGQADANPGHVAAVLLVTDGAPQGPAASCGSVDPEDPNAIATLATAGVGYGVKTFVVGLPGVDLSIANQIAVAGGTTGAIIVDSVDVQNNFKAALSKVRGETLPCSFAIPDKVEKGQVDPRHVNVEITPGGGSLATLPQNADCGDDGLGWKYDDPADPKQIILCPKSCDKLQSDYAARVDILLGCVTILK